MQEDMKRLIKILGIIFQVIFGLMFLIGIGTLMVSLFIKHSSAGSFPPANIFLEHSLTNQLILANFKIFAAIQAILAAFLFYTSIQFAKLRLWARTVLELFCWLIILCDIVFGIDLILSLPGTVPLSARISSLFRSIMALVPFMVLIWFLRNKNLVEAIKNG